MISKEERRKIIEDAKGDIITDIALAFSYFAWLLLSYFLFNYVNNDVLDLSLTADVLILLFEVIGSLIFSTLIILFYWLLVGFLIIIPLCNNTDL